MTLAIFIVGILVFGISVYGAVMAGGLSLTKESIEKTPRLRKQVDQPDQLDDGLPTDIRY